MKLIHCADIHLGSPMQTHMTARQAATRSAEVLRSFVRMTQYARENGVRAVIIAGDLFDGDRVRERTVDAVLDKKRRRSTICICPGTMTRRQAHFVTGNFRKI